MNIYSFLIKKEEDNNLQFVNGLLEQVKFPYSNNLRDKLLVLIEATSKGKLGNIISFEKEIAIQAELCENEAGFIEEVSNDTEWQEYFFEEYPVVEGYLSGYYAKIRKLLRELLLRLDSDFKELQLTEKHVLDNIAIGEGDFHDGKCTCKLTFANGTLLFYKPRSLAIDVEMLQFFMSFQNKLGKTIFYPVKNINKGQYGWSESVAMKACSSEAEVKNYYEGLGIFTALAHALKIEDIIYDNILSTAGQMAPY